MHPGDDPAEDVDRQSDPGPPDGAAGDVVDEDDIELRVVDLDDGEGPVRPGEDALEGGVFLPGGLPPLPV